jgi:hypothetical protein
MFETLKSAIGSFLGAKNPTLFSVGRKVLPRGALRLAEEAYKSPEQRLGTITGIGQRVEGISQDPERIAVYVDEPTKKVNIGFKGTSSLRDIGEDIRIATGAGRQSSDYLQKAQKTIELARQKYPEYSVDTVGHSLGGFISKEVARENPYIRGYGIQAGAGIPEAFAKTAPSNFIGVRTGADPVSALGGSQYTRGDLLGAQTAFNVSNPFTSLIGSHLLSNFRKVL